MFPRNFRDYNRRSAICIIRVSGEQRGGPEIVKKTMTKNAPNLAQTQICRFKIMSTSNSINSKKSTPNTHYSQSSEN